MALQVAQLAVKVTADTAQAESKLTGMSTKTTQAGLQVSTAGLAIAGVLVGIGLVATKMAGDYQAGLTTLVTGAGEAQKNIGMVGAGMLKTAIDTGTTTQQLTAGMFMIESAGYHGAAGLNTLKDAAMGAKVGNADLGVVADATTTIMKDYPNVMNGAAGAVNTLIATVSQGKTHMADLASSMSQILPTASAAGVGLNDIMGAMATMTAEGVPAANAATYLRQMIIALDAPGSKAVATLKSVGLTSAQVANEMKVSLPGAVQMITDAVGKKFPIGSAAYVQAIKDISGGSKTMQGMLDLSGQHMKDFQAAVVSVGSTVKGAGTSIAGWSDVQKDMNFKLEQGKEVVEVFMISLGQRLLPAVTAVAGVMVSFAAAVLPKVLAGIDFITAHLNILGPVLLVVAGGIAGPLVLAFGLWAVSAAAAAVATLIAAAPIILLGAAITAVIVIIVLIVTHIKLLINWFLQAPLPIKILIVVLLGPLIAAIMAVVVVIKVIVAAIQWLISNFGNVVSAVGHFVSVLAGIPGQVGAVFNRIASTITGILSGVIGAVISIGEHIVSGLVGAIANGAGAVGNAVKGLVNNIPGVGGIANWAGFAEGGTVPATGVYWVGEKGPELLHLPRGANITPASQGSYSGGSYGSGGGQVNLHVNMQMNGRTFATQIIPDIVRVIRNATGVQI